MSVYMFLAFDLNLVKIGFTDGPQEKRLAELQTGCPVDLMVWHWFEHGDRGFETYLHVKFESCRTKGEWFKIEKGNVLDNWVNELHKFKAAVSEAEHSELQFIFGDFWNQQGDRWPSSL